ncbi:MAG: hypothetical protein V5A55_12495 [Halovenus sp.]
MGRTNPTYRDFLDRFAEQHQSFRRGLRREYTADFDHLFDHARAHADAAGYHNATNPEVAVLLSILLAHEHELRQLRERLDGSEESQRD